MPFGTKGLDAALNRWKQTTATDSVSLSFGRLVFGFFTLFFYWPSFSWLGTVPDAFFEPPALSLASLFSGFPPPAFFAGLDWVVAAAGLALTVGFYTRFASLALFFALLIGLTFKYSLGTIHHNFMYLCTLFVLAFSAWGRHFSLDSLLSSPQSDDTTHPGNLHFLGLFLAFGFFSAGYGKALSWVDFDLGTSGILSWLYPIYYSYGLQYLLAPSAIALRPLWLWEFADISAVLFELGFVLALFYRKLWFFWLALAALFHLVNCLLLNIPFQYHFAVYLAFVPWYGLLPNLLGKLARHPRPLVLTIAFLSIACFILRLTDSSSALGCFFILAGSTSTALMLWSSLCLWAAAFAVLAVSAYQELKAKVPAP